jgi:hypothetical protein
MAGSPLKRQRKLGVCADGSVITIPRMPRAMADMSVFVRRGKVVAEHRGQTEQCSNA